MNNISIICGENQIASRLALSEKIKNAGLLKIEIVNLDGTKINLEQIRSATGSSSMFGHDKLIIIENLLSSQKSQRKDKIFEYLFKKELNNEIVLWEGKNVDRRTIPQGLAIKVFELDKLLFKFLDSIKPNFSTISLTILKELEQTVAPELIFFMLTRQIRQLILARENLYRGAPWQEGKLKSQAKLFNSGHLEKVYQELQEIDYNQKTGNDALNLISRLDLLIVSL
jgi:DNA polymerase III delta subunit